MDHQRQIAYQLLTRPDPTLVNIVFPKGAIIAEGTGKHLIPGLGICVHMLTDERYIHTFPLPIGNGITGIREMASNLGRGIL